MAPLWRGLQHENPGFGRGFYLVLFFNGEELLKDPE